MNDAFVTLMDYHVLHCWDLPAVTHCLPADVAYLRLHYLVPTLLHIPCCYYDSLLLVTVVIYCCIPTFTRYPRPRVPTA